MLTVKVQGSDVNELARNLQIMAAQFSTTVEPAPAVAVADSSGPVEVVEEPKKEKKTRASKAKETPVETEFTVGAEAPTVSEAVKAEVTKEHVVEAAQKLSSSKNMDAAREVLGKFKNAAGEPCRRISDVRPEDFAAFVSECEKALA
jgi:archaellum component FlaD/FlaE